MLKNVNIAYNGLMDEKNRQKQNNYGAGHGSNTQNTSNHLVRVAFTKIRQRNEIHKSVIELDRGSYIFCLSSVRNGRDDYLNNVVKFLKEEFASKHNLSKQQTKEFIEYLCRAGGAHSTVFDVLTTGANGLSFNKKDKEILDRDFSRKLVEYNYKKKIDKGVKNAAIWGTALGVPMMLTVCDVRLVPTESVDQVHNVKAESQNKNYPPELEKLSLQDLKNTEKVREVLGDKIKKDDSGKEYFEAFGKSIFIDDKGELIKTLAKIIAGKDADYIKK